LFCVASRHLKPSNECELSHLSRKNDTINLLFWLLGPKPNFYRLFGPKNLTLCKVGSKIAFLKCRENYFTAARPKKSTSKSTFGTSKIEFFLRKIRKSFFGKRDRVKYIFFTERTKIRFIGLKNKNDVNLFHQLNFYSIVISWEIRNHKREIIKKNGCNVDKNKNKWIENSFAIFNL